MGSLHLLVLAAGLAVSAVIAGSDLVTRKSIVEQLSVSRSEDKGISLVAAEAPRVSFRNIQFAFNSADLAPEAAMQLTELGAALNAAELQAFVFEIVGHTDARGDREYNRALSERRARAVARFLATAGGVDPSRLKVTGRGDLELSLPDRPYAAENRRVEIRNLGPGS